MMRSCQTSVGARCARPFLRRTRRSNGCLICLLLFLAACNMSGRPEGEAAVVQRAVTTAPAAGGQSGGAYSVYPGDTVYGVAQRLDVPVRALIEANSLKPPYRLTPGQRLVLPGRAASDVAAEPADLSPEPLSQTASTGGSMTIEELPSPGMNAKGTVKAKDGSTGTLSSSATSSTIKTGNEEEAAVTEPEEDGEVAALPDAPGAGNGRFIWPVQGKVVSRFGSKKGGQRNDGINIAADPGTAVVAADSGVVAYAGNELRGFGNLVLIRHADGYVTAYAHNSKLLVKRGDKVKRGQKIARVGSSGNVDSPQLHFEIRKGTDPVDPMQHLNAQRAAISPVADPAGPPDPG